MKIVLKLGGFAFPSKPDLELLQEYAKLINSLLDAGHRMVIVTGGGAISRAYIDAARRLEASESFCDEVGIWASRLNAMLLIACLGERAYPAPPTSIPDALKAFETGKVVVLGGLTPGHSTDAVAALVAESIGANALIRTTDVEGVYTADPKADPSAKKLDVVTTAELFEMVMEGKMWAGGYPLLDPIAVRIIERSRITTWIIDGRDPQNVRRIVEGQHVGTLVKPSRQGSGDGALAGNPFALLGTPASQSYPAKLEPVG